MDALYLVPVQTVLSSRVPKYFFSGHGSAGIPCSWSAMDYGFMPTMLLYARGISNADHAALVLNADVYAWPTTLNQSISAQDTIKTFCEGINIPTDWTTPATTYLQLLRSLAGMFQFSQLYSTISGGQALLGGGVTLATRYRNMTAQQQTWFSATVEGFGYSASLINQNSTLRQLLKLVADAWGATPFLLGGMEF